MAAVARNGTVPEAKLQTLARDFGLTYRPVMGSLRVALPLGTVTAAPRTLHRMIHSVQLGVHGRAMAVPLPSIVAATAANPARREAIRSVTATTSTFGWF